MNSCHCSLFIEKKVQKFPTERFMMHLFPQKMCVIDLADASGREDYEFEFMNDDWLIKHLYSGKKPNLFVFLLVVLQPTNVA